MKVRTLTVLGITFGALLVSRVAAVSLEVTIPDEQVEEAKPIESTEVRKSNDGEQYELSSRGESCLSGVVLETVTNDMERLIERKAEIDKRQVALQVIERKMEERLAEIEAAKGSLDVALNTLKNRANEDLTHLVGMYEAMKPGQAAEIFDSMDAKFAAGFLREMDSQTAGFIMASMNPRKSYAISVIIAGQNEAYRR